MRTDESAAGFNGADSHNGFPLGPLVNDTSGTAARYLQRYRGRWKFSLAAMVLLALLVGGVYWNWDRIAAEIEKANVANGDDTNSPAAVQREGDKPGGTEPAPTPPDEEKPAEAPAFPRRILAVSVNNYLYANPISNGGTDDDAGVGGGKKLRPDRSFHKALTQLAEALHVSPGQVVELSDTAPRPLAKPPLKPVIESTVKAFLDSCRTQDRILVIFVGHVVEMGDDCFLVPIEGDLGDKETLIPLKWLLGQLAACKAQQKVLVMDVCRFNPSRGLERPGTGPMGPKLDAMLANPPAGVQVWSACTAGQYSYEGAIDLPDKSVATTGYFVNELMEAVGSFQKRVNTGIQQPQDPLPLEILAQGDGKAKGVNAGTTFEVKDWYHAEQTPRLAGKPAATQVAFDPKEPLPGPVAIPIPALPAGEEPASRALVQRILSETDAETTRDGSLPLRFEALPVFDAKKLETYVDDGKRTPLRDEIVRTTQLLKKHSQTFKEEFRQPKGEAADAGVKAFILDQQKGPAKAFEELLTQLDNLKEIGEAERSNEKSKRWRANYDFVLAKLEARLAYVYEYNYMLGQIRKDNLPKIDPAKHAGWRLASQAKLQSGSDARKLAADATKILNKVAKDHRGTPWEVLARRQALTAVGLTWQPLPRDSADK